MLSHQRQVVDLTDEPDDHAEGLVASHNDISTTYFTVAPTSSRDTQGDIGTPGRAAKRLKCSVADSVSSQSQQMTSGQAREPLSKRGSKAPSVRDMNQALNGIGSRVPILDQVPTIVPRALQIDRIPHSPANPGREASSSSSHAHPTYALPPIALQGHIKIPVSQSSGRSTPDSAACTSTTQTTPKKQATETSILGHLTRPQDFSQSRQALNNNGKISTSAANCQKQGPWAQASPRLASTSIATNGHSSAAHLTAPLPTGSVPVTTGRSKFTNQFTLEQDHYLIFLKEVKAFQWKQITSEFNAVFPTRAYHTLQSRYSTVLNKRNRSLDPVALSLPSQVASEAVIDWKTVHANTRGPTSWSELNALHQKVASTKHHDQQTLPRQGLVPQNLPIHQAVDYEYSSGSDCVPRRKRRSCVARANYTWSTSRQRDDDLEKYDRAVDHHITLDEGNETSTTPVEEAEAFPTAVATVIKEPLDVDFEVTDARLAFDMRSRISETTFPRLPYMSATQMAAIREGDVEYAREAHCGNTWRSRLLHVDFDPDELELVEESVIKLIERPIRSRHRTKRRQLREHLKNFTEPQVLKLLHELRRHLRSRDKQSIQAFLQDAKDGVIADSPRIQRHAGSYCDDRWSTRYATSSSSMIREREMGRQSRRGWRAASKPLTYQVKNKTMDTLGSAASWTGASGDIHAVAWAPNSETFAAAAVAVDDPMSMQYNKPNNLLFGEYSQNAIHELAEHYRVRELTVQGPNSTHAMFASQDPMIYNTVSSLCYSRSGNLLYSAGYDGHICAWHIDIGQGRPKLAAKLNVKAPIDMVTINPVHDGVLAAAVKVANSKAVRLLHIDEQDPDQFTKHNLYSSKALSRPDLNILPTALQFEPKQGTSLLAGFGANVRDFGFDTTGDVCLWDIETTTPLNIHGSSVNVFDVKFNPNRSVMPLFAVGCVAGANVNRGTRSTVRLYDERADDRFGCAAEIECKALDINDVIWCPHDEYLIAAGCTDGRTYVWDIRYEMDPLHVLSHGRSVMPLQDGIKHEYTDTGVRFLSWGSNATRLYSGSSDGVVKVWDVTRSKEDAFVKNIIEADSGIMSGAFSPDLSKLVLGEVNGSVNVLEVGMDSNPPATSAKLRYVPYDDSRLDQEEASLDFEIAPNSGTTEAHRLLNTRQLQVAPMGNLPVRQVVQGPLYDGPYDQSAEASLLRDHASLFQNRMAIVQDSQCSLPACKNNMIKITAEEIGDSGRSLDRIPDELSRAWESWECCPGIVPGKSKCTQCGRSARPSCDSFREDSHILCERCAFACFRCGAPNCIMTGSTRVSCNSCAAIWDIGTLGFEPIQESRPTSAMLQVPPLMAFERTTFLNKLEDVDTSFGCEMNALSDHYFSLAFDRPESPPL